MCFIRARLLFKDIKSTFHQHENPMSLQCVANLFSQYRAILLIL